MLGKLLVRYLKPHLGLLTGVLVFQFASAMASLYLPRLNADIIDNGVAAGDTAYIWSRGVLMLGIAFGHVLRRPRGDGHGARHPPQRLRQGQRLLGA